MSLPAGVGDKIVLDSGRVFISKLWRRRLNDNSALKHLDRPMTVAQGESPIAQSRLLGRLRFLGKSIQLPQNVGRLLRRELPSRIRPAAEDIELHFHRA